MLFETGPKLIDFDTCLLCDNKGQYSTTSMFGTPYYYSPERIKENYVSPESIKTVSTKDDIWSFGVTCFEILSGQYFLESVQGNIYLELVKLTPQYVSDKLRQSSLPLRVKDFLTRTLEWDKDKRPNITEVINDPVFDPYREQIPVKIAEINPLPGFYSQNHLTVIKEMDRLFKGDENLEVFFLTFNLIKKIRFLTLDMSLDREMYTALVCYSLASRIIRRKNLDINRLLDSVSIRIETESFNSREIEGEIIEYLVGILNDDQYFKACHNLEQLRDLYYNLILNRDPNKYISTELDYGPGPKVDHLTVKDLR